MRSPALGALAGVMLGAQSAPACPCRGSAGPAAPLTAPYETWGASLTQSVQLVHGVWDAGGRYASLGEGERQSSIDYGLAAGFRPWTPVELAAQASFGRQSVVAGSFSSERKGVGDTTLRVRWEAVDEPMPLGALVPALAFMLVTRAPSGSIDGDLGAGAAAGTTGSIGSSASSQGLGAWEFSLAAEAAKSFGTQWQAIALLEGAYRSPDDALHVERKLGPRVLAQASLRFAPTVEFSCGLMTDLGWEGEVELAGRTRSGTAQRLWTAGAFVSWLFRTGLRAGVLVRHAPAVEEVSANALGATSLGVSLGFSR